MTQNAINPHLKRRKQHRWQFGLVMGGVGVLTACAMLIWVDTSALRYVWINEFGMIVLAAIGAGGAGLATFGLFGINGPSGWAMAVLGSVVATLFGGAIAGTVVFPGYGTVFAAAFVVIEGGMTGPVCATWAMSMIAVHSFARRMKNLDKFQT